METRKIDLLELSEAERDKVLGEARSYIERQKKEAKILNGRLTSLKFRFKFFWHSIGQGN